MIYTEQIESLQQIQNISTCQDVGFENNGVSAHAQIKKRRKPVANTSRSSSLSTRAGCIGLLTFCCFRRVIGTHVAVRKSLFTIAGRYE